jgi:hypothetical protein
MIPWNRHGIDWTGEAKKRRCGNGELLTCAFWALLAVSGVLVAIWILACP